MKKIRNAAVVILFSLAGCSSPNAIDRNYNNLVHLENGVDPQEAKIIAQKKLLNTEEKDAYRVSYPDLKNGAIVSKYPGYWFVVFGHNWLEPMSKDALTVSYTELREANFLVVIDKKTGDIPFYGEWYPKRENDFDWVFDPTAYKRKDPLALPPGNPSKEIL